MLAFALGLTNFTIFRYQHVGTLNVKLWSWVSKPMPGPNANGSGRSGI